MTRILLLGLVPRGTGPLPCPEPHLHLPAHDWEALALPLDASDDDAPQEDAARMIDWATRQNAVLSRYIPQADVVPVALGAVFSGAGALRAHLRDQADVLEQAARNVAGRCEYLLQIRPDEDQPAPAAQPPSGGSDFLRQRKGLRDARAHRARDRQRFVQQVGDRLSPLTTRTSPRDVAGKALLADLSLLVARDAEADLIATLRTLSGQSSALGLALRLIGPSPAYSFVETADV